MELITKKGEKKNLIFGKYKLTKIIGSGSFGYVYEGINVVDNKKVAVKVENKEKGLNLLEKESFYLYNLKGVGLPEVISFGYSGKHNILVQSLLGESLGRIFYRNKNIFSLKDICMFSIQILHRIEHVHSKYIIHRDIKPENFLIGEPDKYLIYIIDFGLSKKYKSSRTNKHVQFRLTKKFTGTARYASLNAIRGAEQSRRDDLEAIGYMLLFFFNHGKLPWQGVSCKAKAEKYSKIYYMKKTLNFDEFCKNMPKEIITYMQYCRELEFEQKPDYDYLRGLFENVLKSNGTFNDLHFSWIKDISILKNYKNIKNRIKQININKRKESPQSRIFKKLESSRDINKEQISDNGKEKMQERESENGIKSLKTNNSLQNIQNIVILKSQTTPQYIIHKRFNSSGDNILVRSKDSENYKSGIAQYNISLEDEDQLIDKTFTTKKGNINSIQKILNKNLSYNKQIICKNSLYYFSGNVNDLSKSLVMKNMNNNKLNEYGMEQSNNNINNHEIKKQNSTFFNHNRLFSSNSINRSATNNYNVVSQNIIKSFSFIKKNKPKIEENKERKENININLNYYNNQKYHKNLNSQKFSFNKKNSTNNNSNNNTNNNTKNNTKNNSNNNTKLNSNNNINMNANNNNQLKKKVYNFENKYKSLKISFIKNNIKNNIKSNNKNNIKKQNTNININKSKNNTFVNKISNNNTTKIKPNNFLNLTKVKKLENTTVKKDKKRKIIKKKIKNIPNIQISSNNLNCRSAANIFKKNTSPNNQNNLKYSFIQNINNKHLKKENPIKTENFSCNNNFNNNNNLEGKINKIKNIQIHSNIKKKDSLSNYKKITTQEIFKHNINNNNKKNEFNNYNILNINQSRINKYKNLRHKNAKQYENYPTQKTMTGIMDSSMQKTRITNQTINTTINNCNTVNNTINSNNNNNTIISIYNNYNIDKNNNRYGFIHKKININNNNIALDTLNNINKEKYKNNNYSYNGYKVKLNNYKSYIHLNPRKNATLNNMPSINQLSNYATLNSKLNNDSNNYSSQVLSNKDFSYHENYPIKKMTNYFSLNNYEKEINEFNQNKIMNLSSSRTNLNSYRIKKMLNDINNNREKDGIIIKRLERNKTENYVDLNTKFFLKNNRDKEKKNKRYEHTSNINRSNSFLYGSNYLNFGFKNKNILNKIDYNNLPSINRKNTEIFYQGLPNFKMNYNIYDSNIMNKKNELIYKHNRSQSRDYYHLNYNSNRCKKSYDIFS